MSGYEVSTNERACPGCEAGLGPDAVICTRCGLNLSTGRKVTDRAPAPATLEKPKAGLVCARCGYDLRGLGGKPCPECGQTPEGRRKGGSGGYREERREEEIAGYWRATWMIGGFGIAAGLGLVLGVGVAALGWSVGVCLLHLAVCAGAVAVSHLVLGFFFIGFEEDLRGVCVRSVGIGALWAGLWVVSMLLPRAPYYSDVFLAGFHGLIAAVLVHTLCDRDWDDSAWIGGVAWALRFVPWLLLTQVF